MTGSIVLVASVFVFLSIYNKYVIVFVREIIDVRIALNTFFF